MPARLALIRRGARRSGGDQGGFERVAAMLVARALGFHAQAQRREAGFGVGGRGLGFGASAAGIEQAAVELGDFVPGGGRLRAQTLDALGLGAAFTFNLVDGTRGLGRGWPTTQNEHPRQKSESPARKAP